MKKFALVSLLVLCSSMAHASPGDASSSVASFDFWEWISALFDSAAGADPASIVKSDGTVYDVIVKADGTVYDAIVKADGTVYDLVVKSDGVIYD
ncbi:MAG TPA: hypothetical protein PK861_06610 [Thermomonas sp.]|nr:hypothetical protein [Thermomonas sp.]